MADDMLGDNIVTGDVTTSAMVTSNMAISRRWAILAIALILSYARCTEAQKQGTQAVTNVVLVHGAFADSSSWDKVIPILKAKGLHVVTVDITLTSLADDVAITRRAIADQDGPLLLVGHSYGGTVITQAGAGPKVAGLVYVAAYAPNAGQSTSDLGSAFPLTPGRAEIQPLAAGLLHLTRKGVVEDFAPDLPADEQAQVFARQIPLAVEGFRTKLTTAAWATKPCWYIVATKDRIINPELERSLAKRMDAKTTEIASSHVVMLSHPEETAAVILRAAAGK